MPDITIVVPPPKKEEEKKKPPQEDEEILPGTPGADEPLGAPARMKITFFDLGTKKDGDNWVELTDYYKNVTDDYPLEEETRDLDIDRAAYELRKQYEHYTFVKNAYTKHPDDIEAEFGPDNDAQLERKPLKCVVELSDSTTPPQIKMRDSRYRWDGIGVEQPLMFVSIIKNGDSNYAEGTIARWVNQDCTVEPLLEGDPYTDIPGDVPLSKHNSTRLGSDPAALSYIISNIWFRKAHLRIQEFGSTSTCVNAGLSWYTNEDETYSELDGVSTSEWVEGIFWNNFNTYRTQERTNSEQLFKVTKDPIYTADAVTEPILKFFPAKMTNVEVYLAPRDWMYYAHFSSPGVIEEQGEGLGDWTQEYIEPTPDPPPGGDWYPTHKTYCFWDTVRDDVHNYHTIFCIWDRPPHDMLLPRRRDDESSVFSHGGGKYGLVIPVTAMLGILNISAYDYDIIPKDIYNNIFEGYPSLYSVIDVDLLNAHPSSGWNTQQRYWNDIIMNFGGTFEETEVIEEGVTKYLWTTTSMGDEIYFNGDYYSFYDLGYTYRYGTNHSLINCTNSTNSFYLYNFCDVFYSSGFSYESMFVFPKRSHGSYVYLQNMNDWMTETGKEWTSLREIYATIYPRIFPIWMETLEGGLPHRTTRAWINKSVGTSNVMKQSVWNDEESAYEISYGLIVPTGYYRPDHPISFMQTYKWVYTPPDGGIFKFGTEYNSVVAGRCDPDNDELWVRADQTGAENFDPSKDVIYKMPCYIDSEKPLYKGDLKYTAAECEEFEKIWNKIWNHPLVEDRKSELDDGVYPADNVPYMTAVGLTKAESLIAIVKVDQQIYYIWRTKDEGVQYDDYWPEENVVQTRKRFYANWHSYLPSTHYDLEGYPDYHQMSKSAPLLGCLEVWNTFHNLGHIQDLVTKYPDEYGEHTVSAYRMSDSIVCPTISWDEGSHDTFLGYEGEWGFTYPWALTNAVIENPIIEKEEIFELETPILLMTYRERARFDTGYYASFWANSNCANPSDETANEIEADLRNIDALEWTDMS